MRPGAHDTAPGGPHALLRRILDGEPPPFALLHRPQTTGADRLELMTGTVSRPASLAELPLPEAPGANRHDVLAVLPYRQLAERGYTCPDDGTPLIALTVGEQCGLSRQEFLRHVPDLPLRMDEHGFDIDDDTYADTVRRIIEDEIGRGTGANFVFRRTYRARLDGWGAATALAFFRRLLQREPGAYWTFLIHTGDRYLVGATPEQHVSLAGGAVTMNPISGTYRYPEGGPDPAGVMGFLRDTKESDELFMVLDEELKMMGRVCDRGGRVRGPYLKEMERLAHTEYLIEGTSSRGVRDILRETLFAPTVTGSPLESACRVITKYEPHGRGYYSGVAALIGRDGDGEAVLDSSILIRTADVDRTGGLSIGVGATLVRHSSPWAEVAETRAKAAGLLSALRSDPDTPGTAGPARRDTAAPHRAPGLRTHPDVTAALATRNATLAGYWLADPDDRDRPVGRLAGRRLLVVDAEDTFTSMARHCLGSLGLDVTVRRFDEPYTLDGQDLVIVGPGPGDPGRHSDAKIAHLRDLTRGLLRSRIPFLSVCLGHQVLSSLLGLDIVRKPEPNQGSQQKIDFFGRPELVGFYNTFAARSAAPVLSCPFRRGEIRVCHDPGSGEVHALRGPGYGSVQFHPASVLTRNGTAILRDLLVGVLEDGIP
ncbi:phenazine-specific anthranilate synthase component I [Streptomyces lucensis JCM 4490]|uniref:anthranilate synthase n=1 Tax=Streptomyces lucensis JCM 4490 TaxID=1306176 RepID=A0A918J109_9ACTN|nr:anthranilate synthase family protein [Streptomyces lucensis]GGW41865.1 phenazine-specific anthranilate synthase component I [Streptomyces lucensis JCM 4490]